MADVAESVRLSEAALTLLHRRFAGERVEVTDETRPLYGELVAADLLINAPARSRGPFGLPATGLRATFVTG